MKNTLHFTFFRTLMILAFGLFFNGVWGQAILPVNRTIWNSTPTGWTDAAGGWYTTNFACSGNNGGKFDTTNDNYIVNLDSAPDKLSFEFKSNNTNSTSVVLVQESATGVANSYTTIVSLTGNSQIGSACSTKGPYQLANSTRFVKISFTKGSSNGTIDDLVITKGVSTSTTWNGTAWSSGTPSVTLDAIIAGNYSTGAAAPQGAFTAKSLTVNSGIFTIASGTSVTVENAVTNSAGVDNFIVENNANLVQTTSVANTGAITVLRNSAPIVRLDHTLWSSPVATQNLYAFSPNTLTNRFYVYDTTTDSYVTTGLSASSTFVSGKGFGVRAPNNYQTSPALAWTGTFKGEPNNGDVTFALSTAGTGFNLVGNPYPSTINANLFVNSTNNPAINGTLYFYAHSLAMNAEGNFPAGTNYTTWNSTGHTLATASTVVPNGTIQVGQGFIVKATQAGNVNFTNAMRTADTNNQFFRTANTFTANTEIEKHRIWLDLTNAEGTAFNQILIGYVAGATEGVDRNFDGLSFGNTGSSLSTKIEGAEYAIQARSLPFQSSDVVPVTFKAVTSGNYSINLSNMDGLFAESQDVFLKDNTSGTIHNLKSSAYTFSTTEGTFQNRFEVVYNSALGVAETTFNSNSIVAFKKNNVLNVEAKNTNIASITAYDVQGRLVYTKSNINANAIELSDLKVQNGVLLLQVTSVEGITATIKVIY